MKESYDEGVASHIGPESCGYGGNVILEALTGGNTGRVLCGGWPVRAIPTATRCARPLAYNLATLDNRGYEQAPNLTPSFRPSFSCCLSVLGRF